MFDISSDIVSDVLETGMSHVCHQEEDNSQVAPSMGIAANAVKFEVNW